MHSQSDKKDLVREKYTAIAAQSREQNEQSCCGATACCDMEPYQIMAEDYQQLPGYAPEADLGLGCGIPTQFARISIGDTVVDLGSGAGNDAFVARKLTGETGRVIGIDFTEAMIERARQNAEKLGYENVTFRLGDIEDMPLTSNTADVIVSNCVLNLVPNKHKVFSEIYRVLKPGAHFSISDIVLEGDLPASWREVAELYAGCVSGAIQKNDYLSIIQEAGFMAITLQKDRTIQIPDEVLASYFSEEEITRYRNSGTRIASISVYAEKPAKDERNCCDPGNGCC